MDYETSVTLLTIPMVVAGREWEERGKMEWIIILRSLIELIAQLQFGSPIGRSGQTRVRVRDGIASVQSGSRRPICLLYSYSSALRWGVQLIAISRPHGSGLAGRILLSKGKVIFSQQYRLYQSDGETI